MNGSILWVDSDEVFLEDHVLRLETEGYQVKQVRSLAEGAAELKRSKYDLVIIDLLMPQREEEQVAFPPEETDSGRKAGLCFYRKTRHTLDANQTPVLVFTIRDEKGLRQEFLDEGLPKDRYLTKREGADTGRFLTKIRKIIG